METADFLIVGAGIVVPWMGKKGRARGDRAPEIILHHTPTDWSAL
jgi:hypothetical protein